MRRLRGKDDRLRFFGITRTGLVAMTIAVFALWSCIALEITARHRAEMDALDAIRTLERLRQPSVPVSEPAPRFEVQSLKSS